MSSEEEDYMSESFVTTGEKHDIRPGLLFSHSERRTFQALKRKRETEEANRKKNPSIKAVEIENREDGMNKPIEKTNKGYALLEKMGYKPGTGVGKSETGRVDPIAITVKSDREGLGRAEENKIKRQLLKSRITQTISTDEYRSRVTEQAVQRQNMQDFCKSQRICEMLDSKRDITNPEESWHWPKKEQEKKQNEDDDEETTDSSDDDENEMTIKEKLDTLTEYLRNTYHYCIWCGVEYENIEEITSECPGNARDLH